MISPVFVKSYPELEICESEILRYARCPDPSEPVLNLLHECIKRLRDKLRYQVCYREFSIFLSETKCDLGFTVVHSCDLEKNLRGCNKIILFAATIGLEIDREIMKAALLSPAEALLLQAFGVERIEAVCNQFNREVLTRAQENGYFTRPRFSPGYGDLPLSIQKDVFQALDCTRKIGLTLNSSFLMSPTKSVTALIGLGKSKDTYNQ